MSNIKENSLTTISFDILRSAAEKLLVLLEAHQGVRIGECSVISRKVHMYDPQEPQVLQILQNADAGQSFYHCKDLGRILHIDIFHQCGIIDPKLVAASLISAISIYNENHVFAGGSNINPDRIDIQTGGGGGRITGKLSYGRKPSLCKAHENHVHIAATLPNELLSGVFYIVHAVEKAILASNLELRCNERIVHINNRSNAKVDVSEFSAETDSLLREDNDMMLSAQEQSQPNESEASENSEVYNKNHNEILNPEDLSNDNSNHSKKDSNGLAKVNHRECDEQIMVEMSEQGNIYVYAHPTLDKAVTIDNNTSQQNLTKIEYYLRSVQTNGKQPNSLSNNSRLSQGQVNQEASHRVTKKVGEEKIAELNISETVHAAACRKALESKTAFSFIKSDLRHFIRKQRQGNDICLVIDASSSMDGKRLNAAKAFARQILSRIRGRVGIITFQDNEAQIKVPFTRNRNQLDKGLQSITASGRTPLALGLNAGIQQLKRAKSDHGIIILITDGLPDSPDKTTQQSIDDALLAAKSIKKYGYRFIAIGLKPHQDYLLYLSQEAGGITYVFDEISLVNYDSIASELL